jgi:hypothetical protein
MIAATFDFKHVAANLKNLENALKLGTASRELALGHEIMRLSQMEVPHDEGTLQNSGTVEQLSNGDVIIGYHTDYAARLHEHPEYRFQKGRKGKYLEDPIINNQRALGLQLGTGLQRDIRKALG